MIDLELAATMTLRLPVVLTLLAVSSAMPQLESPSKLSLADFRPASFKVIQFGVSKEVDVIAAFGKPLVVAYGTDGWRYLSYRNIWIAPGAVQFSVNPKSEVVDGMNVSPVDAHVRSVIALLGTDYRRSRWRFAACGDQGNDGGPVYLHPDGQLETMDYYPRGIFVVLMGSNPNRVQSVQYSSLPFGHDRDPCLKEKKKGEGAQ
ncbi:MAG: hypothetical protein KJZ79_12090 [Bryobacteraceae bacterium]|nr:hypothetical protein [Bryobacteraceae bacterium]